MSELVTNPLQTWAAAKQEIETLNETATEPARRYLDACRALWRHELINRYPNAEIKKAKIVIRIQATDDPQKIVALGEQIIARGGAVEGLVESEGAFYVIVN